MMEIYGDFKMHANKKGREIQGLSVLDIKTGKYLGEVKDIIYCSMENKVRGFLLSDNSWLWGARILLYDQVVSIGPDVIMVDGEDKIHSTKYHADYKSWYEDRIEVRGCELVSDTGKIVGTIKDLIIDPYGNIVGYELSDGFVQDLLVGRRTIPVPEQYRVSDGLVIFQSTESCLS